MKSGVLVRALVPVMVAFVFALARRYLPAPLPKENSKETSVESLSARFASKQWIVGLGMIATGIAVAWGFHWTLVTLNRFLADRDGPASFTLLPQPAIWWFFPGFAALTTCWDLTLGAWSLVGNRHEVAMYSYWTSEKAGLNSTKVLRIMMVAIALPIGILTGQDLGDHAILRDQDIRTQGYAFRNARTFRYADARTMLQVDGFRDRNGKLVSRAGIVLVFANGDRWRSADWGEFVPYVDPDLVRFLELK